MAPEQTDSGGPPITLRADLYALGLIAFRLLTGRTYWVTGSLAQLLAQLLAEPMPPASERGATLGPAFDAWFARACDRAPAGRFASAREQIEALARALSVPLESTAASGRRAAHPCAGRREPEVGIAQRVRDRSRDHLQEARAQAALRGGRGRRARDRGDRRGDAARRPDALTRHIDRRREPRGAAGAPRASPREVMAPAAPAAAAVAIDAAVASSAPVVPVRLLPEAPDHGSPRPSPSRRRFRSRRRHRRRRPYPPRPRIRSAS